MEAFKKQKLYDAAILSRKHLCPITTWRYGVSVTCENAATPILAVSYELLYREMRVQDRSNIFYHFEYNF